MLWKNWSTKRLGVALAIFVAFGFSFKATFVKSLLNPISTVSA